MMASLRTTMRSSTFTFWNARAEQLPLTWDDAKRRLTEQAEADAASAGHATPRHARDMITIHDRRALGSPAARSPRRVPDRERAAAGRDLRSWHLGFDSARSPDDGTPAS